MRSAISVWREPAALTACISARASPPVRPRPASETREANPVRNSRATSLTRKPRGEGSGVRTSRRRAGGSAFGARAAASLGRAGARNGRVISAPFGPRQVILPVRAAPAQATGPAGSVREALDARPAGGELRREPLVAPIQMIDAGDHGLPLRREPGEDQRDRRAQVGGH